jgi:molybdopterin synthase catalytic subunit
VSTSPLPPVHVAVQADPFDVGAETEALRQATAGRAGALAAFVGTVRDHYGDEAVSVLELEHYPGMTEAGLEAMARRAVERFDLAGVRVIHRVGRLGPAEPIVLALAAAAHRHAAFRGCAWLMDYLKTDAVFWKREVGPGGARWVEARAEDHDARASPTNPIIPFIEGDGIGPTSGPPRASSTRPSRRPTAARRRSHWYEVLAGEKGPRRQTGEWLPEATLEAFQ